MHFTCVICSELITASDDTFVTKCGHLFHYNCVIQWLERSKTCPQCRAKVCEKSISRVYFNVANIDGSDDPSSLQNKIDSLKFKLKMKDIEVKSAAEANATSEIVKKSLRVEVREAEAKASALSGELLCLKERMNHLKSENKKMNQLQEDNKMLRSRVDTLYGLEAIRNGSAADVDDLLNSLTGKSAESRSLATYCSVLKRELLEMEKKRKLTQSKMAEYSQNISKVYGERDSLKEALKANERAYSNLIEELLSVKEEKDQLEKKVQQQKVIIQNKQQLDLAGSSMDIIAKLKTVSPSKENMATEMLRILSESPAPEDLLSTLKKIARSPKVLYPPTERETLKRNHIEDSGCLSPETLQPSKRNFQLLGAPKLSDPTQEGIGLIKSSSRGNQPKTQQRQVCAKQGYSIFQKARLCQRPQELLLKNPKEDVYYDGMGGQRKPEIFPNPKRNVAALGAKPKLKKPASVQTSTGLPRIDNYLGSSSR